MSSKQNNNNTTTKNLKKKKRVTRKKQAEINSNPIIQVPMKKNTEISLITPTITTPIESTSPTKKPKKKSFSRQPLEKSELVKLFLEMLTTIKLYHWNTHSYSSHKATDELHDKMSELVDQFVEVMQGKMISPNRIRIINDEISAYTPESKTKMVDKVLYYIEQLQNLSKFFSTTKDSDLLNIRDEMLSHLNQFLYLFSFDEI